MININPIELPGNWAKGYALDLHTLKSQFIGYDEFGHEVFDTERSQMGDLLYELKYRSNKAVLDEILDTAVEFIRLWKINIDTLIPVPPSRTARQIQAVLEVAKGISHRLQIPLLSDAVKKIKDTPELKNIYDYAERLTLLESAFAIGTASVENKNILLLDDLYRSGATLNAITHVLLEQGMAKNVYVLALTKTRSKT